MSIVAQRWTNLGTHSLSCKFSQGRLSRHKVINDIIFHSLATANISSRLEPPGLFGTDGKRPDGVSVAPWSQGKHLVWDATCVDTFCASNLRHSSTGPGGDAAIAELRPASTLSWIPCTSSNPLPWRHVDRLVLIPFPFLRPLAGG